MSDARERNDSAQTLGTPQQKKRRPLFQLSPNPDAFGQMTEKIARFMGTPQFLLWMTIFCALWLGWNTLAPEELQFDPRSLNFTLLTLMLSLQASYAAPLLLLAQNRQDDRDRVVARQDRQRDQRNLEEPARLPPCVLPCVRLPPVTLCAARCATLWTSSLRCSAARRSSSPELRPWQLRRMSLGHPKLPSLLIPLPPSL